MMVEGNFLRSTLIKMLYLPVNRNPRWEAVNVKIYQEHFGVLFSYNKRTYLSIIGGSKSLCALLFVD